ncbi:hypothetical protein B0T21DRAFT_354564 [Apiosordaria backusii]|uniref:Uncharacterized protein n=1 Tax=Apiosordaria backusii TaxID=314023 RepID=A0AA40K690_9PEZI|nr:hypothetical protein B0T21DRAFT_354564 [Apiosordaria backusii]
MDIWSGSTHGGLALLLNHRFSANYTMYPNLASAGGPWLPIVEGYFAYEMATYPSEESCDRVFKDPGPVIFNAVRELGLRLALKTADTSDPKHRLMLEGEQAETIVVYVANFGFLYGAIAVTILATISVIPLYYGFWKLGREVSMSPLEIAKAFRPVQLEGVASNATAEGLLKGVGQRPIMYGVVDAVHGDEKGWVFGMGEPEGVVSPDEMGKMRLLEGEGEGNTGDMESG